MSLCACSTAPDFRDPRTSTPQSLGELVYQILLANLSESETCSAEYVATLEAEHDDFVLTFDYLVDGEVLNEVPEILGEVLVPIVESGDLERLTDAVAQALALLISDEFDPERLTIRSTLALQDTRTVLEGSMALELVSRLLADPNLTDRVHDLAQFAQLNDGVDYTLDALLYIAERRLDQAATAEPSMCTGLEIDSLEDTLLSGEGFTFGPQFGAPAWVPRVDVHGNARVAGSPGNLAAPFVDADRDGAADVNADGAPVDSNGAEIEIAALGDPNGPGRDADGRAITATGELVYEYYDAKRTGLSAVLQMARSALEDDVHRDLVGLATAALGAQEPCDDGTDTCRRYSGDNNPLADIVYMLFEIGKFDRPQAFVDTLAVVVNDNPQLAEELLVEVGGLIEQVDTQTDISITDPALVDLAIDIGPLVEDVLDSNNSSGESTARILLDVLVDVRREQPDFLERLGWLIDYVDLQKNNTCSGEDPNLLASTPVDYSMPRWIGGVGTGTDNRSALERVVQLLYVADCGSVPGFVPGVGTDTIAYELLDLLVQQSPSTVCTVIDVVGFVDGLFTDDSCSCGFFDIGCWIQCAANQAATAILSGMGCNDDPQAILDDLGSLQPLAGSGSLDALIPLAKLFDDRGQLRLLVNILGFLHEDLILDDDGDPNTSSLIRPLLPIISDLIESGGADKLLDVLELMVTIEASDNPNDTMADVVIDSLERMTETGTVQTRQGPVPNTSLLRETLLPLRSMISRVSNRTGGLDALDGTLDYVVSGITDTRLEAGRERLGNPNLMPLAQMLLTIASDAADLSQSQYQCYIGELQEGSVELLLDRDFATVKRLIDQLLDEEEGQRLEAWVEDILTPNAGATDTELYGPILQLLSAALTSELPEEDLSSLFRYLGAVSGQLRNNGRDLLGTIDGLLTTDAAGTVVRIARDAISDGPLPSGELPICTFADDFSAISDIQEDMMCQSGGEFEVTPADVETTVDGVVDFLRDDEAGLGSVLRLVGALSAVQEN